MKLKKLAVLITAVMMTVLFYMLGATVYSDDDMGEALTEGSSVLSESAYHLEGPLTLSGGLQTANDKTVHLYLNSQTLTLAEGSIGVGTGRFAGNATLYIHGPGRIEGSNSDGCIQVLGSTCKLYIVGTGITIENTVGAGIYDNIEGAMTIGTESDSDITIIGGTYGIYKGKNEGIASITNASIKSTSGAGIYSKGNLNITDSTIVGGSYGIQFAESAGQKTDWHEATISGATISASSADGYGIYCGSNVQHAHLTVQASAKNSTKIQANIGIRFDGNVNTDYLSFSGGEITGTTYGIQIGEKNEENTLGGGTLNLSGGIVSGGKNGVRIESNTATFNLSGNPNITCNEESITGKPYEDYEGDSSLTGLDNPNAKNDPLYQVADIFLAAGSEDSNAQITFTDGGLTDSTANVYPYSVWADEGSCYFTNADEYGYNQAAWGGSRETSKFTAPKSEYFTYDMTLDNGRFRYLGTVYVYFDFLGSNGDGDDNVLGNLNIDGIVQNVTADNFKKKGDEDYYKYISWVRYITQGTLGEQKPLPAAGAPGISDGNLTYDSFYWVGYIFEGWYDQKNEYNTGDPKGTKYTDTTDVPTEKTTLYAYWRLCNHQNGGTYTFAYLNENQHYCTQCGKTFGHVYEEDFEATEQAIKGGRTDLGLPTECGQTVTVIHKCVGSLGADGTRMEGASGCNNAADLSYTAPRHWEAEDYEDEFGCDDDGHWFGLCTNYIYDYDPGTKTYSPKRLCNEPKNYQAHNWVEEWDGVEIGAAVGIHALKSIETAPKCYEKGTGTIECTICAQNGKSSTHSVTLKEVPHNYEYTPLQYLTNNEAKSGITVNVDGKPANYVINILEYHYIKCQWFDNCKYTDEEEHTLPQNAVVVPPTCWKDGYERYNCNVCGNDVDNILKHTGEEHIWTTVSDGAWKDTTGKTNLYLPGTQAGHWFTCTNKRYNEAGQPIGINGEVVSSEAEAAFCGAGGEEKYHSETFTQHTFTQAVAIEAVAAEEKDGQHDLYEVVEVSPATCMAPRKIRLKCIICGVVSEEIFEVGGTTDHTYAEPEKWYPKDKNLRPDDAPALTPVQEQGLRDGHHWRMCTIEGCGFIDQETHENRNDGIVDAKGYWIEYAVGDPLYEQYHETHHHQICKLCNEDIRQEHTVGTLQEYDPGTCQEDGYQSYICAMCPAYIEGETVPKDDSNHAWVETNEFWKDGAQLPQRRIDPQWDTKVASGKNFYSSYEEHGYQCTNPGCTELYKDDPNNTYLEHKYTAANVDTDYYDIDHKELEATCTKPAWVYVKCVVCEEHGETAVGTDAVEYGKALGHIYEYDDFVPNYVGGVLQNIPETRTEIWRPDSEYGTHTVDPSVEDLDKAFPGGFHWHECVRYEEHDDIRLEGHSSEGAESPIKVPATCMAAGYERYQCTVCLENVDTPIPRLVHSFDYLDDLSDEQRKEYLVRELTDGDEHYFMCKWYNETPHIYQNASIIYRDDTSVTVKVSDTETITFDTGSYTVTPNENNTEVTVKCIGATPEKHTATNWQIEPYPEGYEEENRKEVEHWQVCTICGEQFNKGPHNWSDWTPAAGKEADCSAETDGKEERRCSDCGAREERDVKWQDSHKFRWTCLLDQEGSKDDLANMDKEKHWLICTVCGLDTTDPDSEGKFNLGEGEDNTGGHVLSAVGEVIEAATETKTGLMKYPCTAEGCEYYETRVIPVVTKATQSSPTQSSPTVTPPTSGSTTSSSSTSVTPATDENGDPVESSTDPNETTPVTDESGKPIESSGSGDSSTCATNENGDPVPPGSTPNDDPTVRPPTSSDDGNDPDGPGGNGGNGGNGNGGADVGNDGENGNRPSIENSFNNGISSSNGAGSPGTSLGNGRVIVGVDRVGDAPNISIDFASAQQLELESINKHISDDEKSTIRSGVDMKILLTVSNIIKEQNLSDTDRMLADTFLANSTYTEGQYLDISIIKYLNDVQVGRIFQLDDPIAVSLEIPEVLRRANRSYAVVRIHSGSADLLYDLDSDPDTITILSDKFSTYVIVYRDYAPGEADANANNPYTGIPWSVIAMLAFAFPIGAMTYVFSRCRVR